MKPVKLAIDAGHGMGNARTGVFDPGACAGGVRECDIALDFALALKAACVDANIAYYLIRDDNTDAVRVDRRDDLAEAHGCTHYLALHCNASDAAKAGGTETFYRASDASDDKPWARSVQKAIVSATGLAGRGSDRGLKIEAESPRGTLAVLGFGPPAALVEMGFITNLKERSILLSRATRAQFAAAVAASLVRYRDGEPL